MKFIFVDTYYPQFLHTFRQRHPDLGNNPYMIQQTRLLAQSFGTSDFYSYNLKQLGHKAWDIIANDISLQSQWAKEHQLKISFPKLLSQLQALPLIYRFFGRPKWIQEIALAQIKKSKPDILYLQDLTILNPPVLKTAKRFCRLLVGQIASPLPEKKYLSQFDLILTSFPHYVQTLRNVGTKSEYFKIAFDPRILQLVSKLPRVHDVSFVGSFTPYHLRGTRTLETLASSVPLHIWGSGLSFLSPKSPLQKNYHGQAWGLDMYRILAQSKIVINRHISAANGYANNMRLYESTGMGALLVTDHKKNLNDLFKVGHEVVSYKSPQDLIAKVKYYLSHDKEREKIANAGQKRTLKDHTYAKRMKELVGILNKYL